MIPSYARHNFEIADTDDKQTILNKRFLLELDRIGRQIQIDEQLKEFERKYNEIKRLKQSSKATIDQLKLQLAIEDFLN